MDVDYVINKMCNIELMTGEHAGETIQAVPGTGLSAEEVEAWPERAVRHMIDSGFMSRVTAGVGVKELVKAGMGVEAVRDGVSDVPVAFGPTGVRLTQEEDVELPEPEKKADEPDDYPVSLGGNKFRLSDGSEVSGKRKAMTEQAKLDEA